MKQKEFISKLYPVICKYASEYGIDCPNAVMAQAIIESEWGLSSLAAKYNNYFGMKAGSSWKGKTAELATNDYVNGKLVKRKQTFRAYDTIEGGICGYFEFLNYKRYAKLHGVKDVGEYARLLVECGYTNYEPYTKAVIDTVTRYVIPLSESVASAHSGSEGLDVIARDVIRGVYGNGHETRASMIFNTVQARVNALAAGAEPDGSAVDTVAAEVMAGAFGNGAERRELLYDAVRERVNRIIKEG